jgi:hypothetical protein
MKAKDRYPDLDDDKRFLEYVLEILHHCLHPDGYKQAEEMLTEVTEDAKENYPVRIEQINRATEKFKKLKECKESAAIATTGNHPDTVSYYDTFREFRDILMEKVF